MVLFSSDVSARGLHFGGVSLVIQCQAPSSREVYIHRMGRTGRADESGQSTLLLTEPERCVLSDVLEGLPIKVETQRCNSLSNDHALIMECRQGWLNKTQKKVKGILLAHA